MVQDIVMDEELVQDVAMGEKFVKNFVMGEQFVKNFVMDAKIDPKVQMDLSILRIGGWNILQPINQNLLEESIEEDKPQFLLREGLHEMAKLQATTLQPATICMNIQEDIRRGENLRG